MLPRRYRMNPAFCSVLATTVTLVRRTPSIWAKNSCVSCMSSEPVRSRIRNSHRHMRSSTVWLALQPADCCACASNTCSCRMRTECKGSNSVGEPSQVFRAYCRGLTSDLNKASVQRGPAIERGRAIDHSVAADHGSFDHLAYTQVDDERNHAGE